MLSAIDTTGYTKPTVWCGPGAISALTGAPLTLTTSRLATIANIPYAKLDGVYPEHVIGVLHELGYRALLKPTTKAITLQTFFATRRAFHPVLIMTPGHFLTFHLGFACDNWTMKPVPASQFPKPRRLVYDVWSIEPL